MGNENIVVRVLNKLADLLILNLLFLVTSLPVFTIGAGLAAMYTVSLRSVRYGDGYVAKVYFQAFRRNFRQATAAWLLCLAALVLLFFDIRFWSAAGTVFGGLARGALVLSYGIAILFWIVAMWLFPVIAKMDDKLSVQIKNAAKMVFGYFFPYTAVCLAIQGFAVFAAVYNTGALMILAVFGIAGVSYICSFFFYRVFAKMINEEPFDENDPLYGGNDR